jgi:uracil-DNA glycosylase
MKPSIVLVGEALGDSELKLPGHPPLVGPSGAELIRMLAEANVLSLTAQDRSLLKRFYAESNPAYIESIWSHHPEIVRTNVFRSHPPRNDITHFCGPKSSAIPGYPALTGSKFIRREYEPDLDALAALLLHHDPNLVIPLGNTPLWCLAGQTGISKIRGTTLLSTHTALDFKLLPTYHPAAVIRDWSLRPTTIADLMKARRESAFPDIRRPHREIHIEPTLEEIDSYIAQFIRGCSLLSCDIETAGNRITCIGFAPSSASAIVIPFDDSRRANGSYWPTVEDERRAWRLVRGVLEDRSIPKLFQNGAYDIAFLWRAYGIKTMGAAEDTMLLSHALQPEALKGLGYLGSIYSDEGAWKFMRKKHETIKRDE